MPSFQTVAAASIAILAAVPVVHAAAVIPALIGAGGAIGAALINRRHRRRDVNAEANANAVQAAAAGCADGLGSANWVHDSANNVLVAYDLPAGCVEFVKATAGLYGEELPKVASPNTLIFPNVNAETKAKIDEELKAYQETEN